MSGPPLTDLAASLPRTVPFTGPETLERQSGRPFRARLGANESVFGPSPHAIAAMERAARDAWMYPDPESYTLRHALAAHNSCAPETIVVGAGIDGLLGSIVRLIVAPGDSVVTSDGAYPTFNYHVAACGGTLARVPYRNDHEDPDALLAKARETGAKLIYLSNPDNPMGSWHNSETIAAMIARVPDGCLLVLDEAYLETGPAEAAPPLDTTEARVVRMRTFSKAYGMAGARIGYAIGTAELISAFGLVRNHFGVSRIAQAGALAALEDGAHLDWVRNRIARSVETIGRLGRENGLDPLPTATNFVALDCGGSDRARAILAALAERQVFIRMPGPAPLNRCIRISCGNDADMSYLAHMLPETVQAADGTA